MLYCVVWSTGSKFEEGRFSVPIFRVREPLLPWRWQQHTPPQHWYLST